VLFRSQQIRAASIQTLEQLVMPQLARTMPQVAADFRVMNGRAAKPRAGKKKGA